jgi:hypothetical protein
MIDVKTEQVWPTLKGYGMEYVKKAGPFLTLPLLSPEHPIGENTKGPNLSRPLVDDFLLKLWFGGKSLSLSS